MKINENSIKSITDKYTPILLSTTIIQLLFILMCMALKRSAIIFHIPTYLIVVLIYVFFKDFKRDEKTKKIGFNIFKTSNIFFLISIVNHIAIKIARNMKDTSPNFLENIFIVLILLDIATTLFMLGVFSLDFIKGKLEALNKKDTKTMIGAEPDEEIKPGDAVIGYSIEDDKPVILPLKDRYLHMLIIGPTGSGKTSQSIIPMINRDMTNRELGITVIEPKGDLAEKIFAMARYYDREVLYFNPILEDCPYFNPLFGDETDVIENMATTFKMLNPDSSQFFLDMNENTTRKALKILKRLKGDDATLIDFDTLLNNTGGNGKKMVDAFSKLPCENQSVARENSDIAQWFLNDYYSGLTGERGATKTFEHCSGLRSQVAKLTSNIYLRKVLNPPEGQSKYGINFDDALENGKVITIATAQGTLRDLGRYLGYFIILQLQASVFRRPGNEYTRTGNMLYIDEFQVYTNPGFADMLTQGRSYRVASHLATQARDQIAMGGGKDGKAFVTVVDSNARNKIVYPGSFSDADFYSKQFGEIIEEEVRQTKAYDTIGGFKVPITDKISESVNSTKRAMFRPQDIVFRPFGEITYCLIKNNSVQTPGVSRIQYIPKELNDLLDEEVARYNKEQAEKAERKRLEESNIKPYNPGEFKIIGDKNNDDGEEREESSHLSPEHYDTSGKFVDLIDENDNEIVDINNSSINDSEEFMKQDMMNMIDDDDNHDNCSHPMHDYEFDDDV